MRLVTGGVRELHWHTSAEWAFMIYGNARITAVDAQGRSFVNDVTAGDLWLFPGGIPHSIQGLGPDGAMFLLVFNDGGFNEFETFLLTDWFKHTPKDVLAKNFNVPASTFDNIPKRELFIFAADNAATAGGGAKGGSGGYGLHRRGLRFQGEHHAADQGAGRAGKFASWIRRAFPATDIAAAIVRVKPEGCGSCIGIRFPTSGNTT